MLPRAILIVQVLRSVERLTDKLMTILLNGASFSGDQSAAAADEDLPDRRELGLVAVERSRMPMVVTDPRQPNNPIILANQAFIDLTGYTASEIIGQNCRFLQGRDTLASDVEKLSAGLSHGEDELEIEILNYRKDGTAFINALIISAVRSDQGELLYYFASQVDVTAERRAQELEASERRLLMEVDHRTMNALALIQSIVALSRAENVQGLSRSINQRIGSLACTHNLLAERKWRSVKLSELVETQLRGKFEADRIVAEGDALQLLPKVVQPLGLVLHELLSNAQVRGALTEEKGTIRLSWSIDHGMLILSWRETDSVTVQPLLKEGFGLQIVRTVVEQQLGGHLVIDRYDRGLQATIAIPDAIV